MLRAQGVPPTDHYSVLQLHPSAPRLLIVDAYFALSRRLSAQAGARAQAATLRALHAAYAAAMADRREHDPEPVQPAEHHDFYATLCVHDTAGADIIELAYRLLRRDRPLPERSAARYLREEAYRVLSNPQLRARYDEDRRAGTLPSTPRHSLRAVGQDRRVPRKERSPVERRKRRLFGFGRDKGTPIDARDARLLGLRDVLSVEPDEPAGEEAAMPAGDSAAPQAELVFTAGPRAGLRVELDGNVVSFADGRSTASVWRHNDRFLLRHNGRHVRVTGAAPGLTVVVLEDGDEIAVGSERARFMVVPPAI